MVDKTTGAMHSFDDPRETSREGSSAGLLLLYAENHPELPTAWTLTSPAMVVGREPSADLTVAVRAVSRQHAELRRESSGWWVRDLASTNGTLLDGRRIDRALL